MTGKSLLIGFGYINPRYYIEAENDIFVPNTKTKIFGTHYSLPQW